MRFSPRTFPGYPRQKRPLRGRKCDMRFSRVPSGLPGAEISPVGRGLVPESSPRPSLGRMRSA